MKKSIEVSNKEFKELLKKYGSKTMLTFDINKTIKFSDEQLKELKKLEGVK